MDKVVLDSIPRDLLFIFIGIGLGAAFAVTRTTAATPVPTTIASPFIYSFNATGILNETNAPKESTSPYFWVNSGGELVIQDGVGQTMRGATPQGNKWRMLYARNNPLDTDGGLHPQNLFRLISRSLWNSVSEQAQFFIAADNLSSSPNRNLSNGLLLMSRYHTGGRTLYYAGIRVDGTAVIKKKFNGIYYTMAQMQIFQGTYAGAQDSKNLIPHREWIGLRSDTATRADGSVIVTLFMQLPGQNAWQKILQAVDQGQFAGTAPILGPAYAGIRTDFMDLEFQSFKLETL